MLDINLIRTQPEKVEAALSKRMEKVDFSELLEWDKERRQLIESSDALKKQRNRVSSQIPQWKKEGKDTAPIFAEMKQVADAIKEKDSRRGQLETQINRFLWELPNLPDEEVRPGGKENNEVITVWGEKTRFDFAPRNHVDLVTDLKLIDYERGVKLGGSGYWLYTGDGALLEWALLNYFVETHLKDGYRFILPPHLLTYACGFTAGQFPKFEGDVFVLKQEQKKEQSSFLLPTAETALVNLHRDEILKEEDLPIKLFAYSPCYRKEAGSYRTEERGMIRGHQFNKVELFQYTHPDKSRAALDELIRKVEQLVQGLGLHYQVSKLAAGDCGASMAMTLDLEVWIPSMNDYKEVSSVSNARDFQARRGNIRFRNSQTRKNEFLHTLNGSGLATSRLIPALVEQFQRKDGSVAVPKVLQKWVGKELLTGA